jgi:hypothetical protein
MEIPLEVFMQTKPNRLWVIALLLGWCFDFLFWKHTPGISFAIYAVVTLAAGFVLLWLEGIRPARWTLALVPLILFFAAFAFIRLEPLTGILAHAWTLFLMAGLAVTYRGGRWMQYSLADYFSRGFDLLASVIARPLTFAGESRRLKREAGNGQPQKAPSAVWPLVRGLLIAVPVVVFFASLLSAADMVFAQRMQDFVKLFRLENLPEYIFRAIYIGILAYALAGIFLHAATRSSDEKLLGLEKPLLPRFFGFTESAVVLGSVILLFTAFVVIQFQYFFGGQANIHLDGFTYADYARKGFGELVTVAFFALLLFLGLSAIVKRESASQQTIFSILGVVLVALVAVMLVSAYQRLVLYENAYGFTRLRTYTHVFMLWVAVLLAVVVALDLFQRQRVFALAAMLAALGFAASLMLINVDGFIVRQNVQRAVQGQVLDVGYLASLSPDAVPALVDFYHSQTLDTTTRDRLGAVLACIQFQNDSAQGQKDTSWQAFHFSDLWAGQAIKTTFSDLKNYRIDESNWPRKVKTPLGGEYECYSYVSD